MPKCTAKQSIVVVRDDARKTVAPGEVFNFTDDELAQLGADAVVRIAVDTSAAEAEAKAAAEVKVAKSKATKPTADADL